MQVTSYIFVLLAALLSCAMAAPAASVQRRSQSYSGDGTYYSVGLGSCGKHNEDSEMVAALNAPQMGDNKECGQTAKVKGPNGSVTVKIVDTCPECDHGSLDLSPSAFKKIGDMEDGRIDISWEWA
ncbi:hypothetical protein INT44_005466 [Umbelopsis vinacea]|uniref:RlpA-like protein double-psi beta-barrel domain-containing protein n=1 Tax=Umbelopsis vinacea TaxID=44442 RepID=A0A8H7UJ30_9FUNG|nr:hypothetical protein INT44_005466 [Umbelopsis vinacea]KAI9287552.1 RlpA-like double-psi beta-barrel-protein domain-containing protein-containing protein [Umbelopsis sp. AD052]